MADHGRLLAEPEAFMGGHLHLQKRMGREQLRAPAPVPTDSSRWSLRRPPPKSTVESPACEATSTKCGAVLTGGDHDGRVLVAFPSANAPTSSPGTAQNLVSVNLFLSFSDDGGATWSKPKPIAGSVPANGVKRFWPVVTVSPGDASVNVVYYESLEQAVPGAPACNIAIGGGLRRVGPAHSLVNTILARSKDGGRTFGDPVTVSSVTSDWCAGTTNIRPNFGDYIGATTVGTTTFAVWADSRETILIGGTPRNVVDVFFAPVGEGQ